MVILIAGSSHTGKTLLAQRLLEAAHWPYLSLDHLKMGLIRSGWTHLTPESSDEELTALLWPIACEMAKTAIENRQNLVIEGCYIPFHYAEDFPPEYQAHLAYVCLVFRQSYLDQYFYQVEAYADCVEKRRISCVDLAELKQENERNFQICQALGVPFFLLDEPYETAMQTLCRTMMEAAEREGQAL